MLRTSWTPGLAAATRSDVVVSVTEFTADRFTDVPNIAVTGLRLRRDWHLHEGSVGMWLWFDMLSRRFGSVSVWVDRDAFESFVSWQPHAEVMRRYGTRGRLRATSWQAEVLDPEQIWRDARHWLAGANVPIRLV